MKKNIHKNLILLALLSELVLAEASAQIANTARAHIESIVTQKRAVSYDDFSVCFKYGCNEIANLSMSSDVWLQITSIFDTTYSSAHFERAILAEYIARMEQYVGRITHTQFDRAGTFIMFLNPLRQSSNQMDCIDESINTLSYLKMIEREGSVKHHNIIGLVTRGGLVSGYPHTAVLIEDIHNAEKYVIDSWFFDNGRPAAIVPYHDWKKGWKPSKEFE